MNKRLKERLKERNINRIEQIRDEEKNNKYVLYVARDDYEYDDYAESFSAPGKLHIFYDTPVLLSNSNDLNRTCNYSFGNARLIAELPSYMFPNISECTYKKFEMSEI